MSKKSFMNKNPNLSAIIVIIYLMAIYGLIELSIKFGNNAATLFIYLTITLIITIVYSLFIFKLLTYEE